ncbi:MAG: HAD hydrolase-like protein, partial [Candidatus Hermodarchaeota archaeon]
ITATEITKIKKNAKIFVIGEIGLREELKKMGHVIYTNPKDYRNIDFVIVGLDRDFKYENLAIAQKCIMEGKANFYATNTDATLPAARGFLPGAGVMVRALETCTSTKPIKIFGKPQPYGIELIMKNVNIPANRSCIFGDRLETDILAGNRAGILSIAVLTGVVSREYIKNLRIKSKEREDFDKNLLPDVTINKLDDIFKK